MDKKKVNLGIIGCGYWGSNLVRNFFSLDSVEVCYLSDLDKKRAERLAVGHPGTKVTENYKDILNDNSVEAVVIASPTYLHFPLIKESLLAGKNVFVEKPITSAVIEAKGVIELAKEKNKILMVDHTFEFAPAINKIKEIIESGELGELHCIKADWLNLGLLQPDINVIWDLAPHVVSIINYLTGRKAISVSANAVGYLRKNIPEIAQVNIDLEKDLSAYITVSWLDPIKTRRFTVIGSKKFLVFDLMDQDHQVKVYDKGVEIIDEGSSNKENFSVKYRKGELYSPMLSEKEPLREACKHFIDCILEGKVPRSDGESALKTLEILEATDNSLKIGGNKIFIN